MKTPEERGHPASAWARDARDKLGLSDREVVELLGKYADTTLRKAEANSASMSRPLWRALVPLYQGIAAERHVVLPVPPDFHSTPRGGGTPDMAALVTAIEAQARAITALAEAIHQDRDRISPEGLGTFLAQLRAEGLLVETSTLDRPPSTDVPQRAGAGQ